MFCNHCGNQIDDEATVCIHCGCPVDKQEEQETKQQNNSLAIAGFILAFLVPLAGLICSAIGLNRAKKDLNGKGKGLAIAGIVISCIVMIAEIIVIAYYGLILLVIFGLIDALKQPV